MSKKRIKHTDFRGGEERKIAILHYLGKPTLKSWWHTPKLSCLPTVFSELWAKAHQPQKQGRDGKNGAWGHQEGLSVWTSRHLPLRGCGVGVPSLYRWEPGSQWHDALSQSQSSSESKLKPKSRPAMSTACVRPTVLRCPLREHYGKRDCRQLCSLIYTTFTHTQNGKPLTRQVEL